MVEKYNAEGSLGERSILFLVDLVFRAYMIVKRTVERSVSKTRAVSRDARTGWKSAGSGK